MMNKLEYQLQNLVHCIEDYLFPSCPNSITAATVIADAYTDDPKVRDIFMDSFGAKGLLDGEFFYMFADIAAGFVQSSNRTGLCDTLEGLDPLQTLDAMRTLSK